MSDRHLVYRRCLAEAGIERTPKQAIKMLKECDEICNALTYESYLLLKSRTPEDVVEWGRKVELDPDTAFSQHNLLLSFGRIKFEEEGGTGPGHGL